MDKSLILIGYSGHAYVICDAALESGWSLHGYCDRTKKSRNPYDLAYLGPEEENRDLLKKHPWIVAVGDNDLRMEIQRELMDQDAGYPAVIIHPKAIISRHVKIGRGSFLAAGATVNALARIGKAVICNTGSIVEHECRLGDCSHIAPGAVLAAQVRVGDRAFVGAGASVRQGIHIGDNAVVGAGAVVVKDVKAGHVVVGNPAKTLFVKK